jgi:hypothetical protein
MARPQQQRSYPYTGSGHEREGRDVTDHLSDADLRDEIERAELRVGATRGEVDEELRTWLKRLYRAAHKRGLEGYGEGGRDGSSA